MRFRSILLTLGLVLLSLGSAQAQGQQGGSGGGPERRMQALFKDITLTAPQRAAVDSIMHHRSKEGENQEAASPDQRRDQFRKQLADVRALLKPEQQTVFDRNVAEMRSRMEQRGDSGRSKP